MVTYQKILLSKLQGLFSKQHKVVSSSFEVATGEQVTLVVINFVCRNVWVAIFEGFKDRYSYGNFKPHYAAAGNDVGELKTSFTF